MHISSNGDNQMNDKDEKIREIHMREIRKVRPLFAKGVESKKEIKKYRTDFYAKSTKAMQDYQNKHRVVFCKSCSVRERFGRSIYRRLCIDYGEDLLGNDEAVLHVQCFKCGFDMYMPCDKQDRQMSRVDEQDWTSVRVMHDELILEKGIPLSFIAERLGQAARDWETSCAQRNITAQEIAAMQGEMRSVMQQGLNSNDFWRGSDALSSARNPWQWRESRLEKKAKK